MSDILIGRNDGAEISLDSRYGKPPATSTGTGSDGWSDTVHDALFGTRGRPSMIEAMGMQVTRCVGNQLGRRILRGVLGGIFGGRR